MPTKPILIYKLTPTQIALVDRLAHAENGMPMDKLDYGETIVWQELDKLGRPDMMIVVGGVIPPQDFDELYAKGADAIYPPGTIIPDAAVELLEKLRARLEED